MLEKAFHAFMKSKKMPKDMEHRIWLAAPYAYQRLYGKDTVIKAEMRKLKAADARKIDLFYQYVCHMIGRTQKRRASAPKN